MAERGLHAALFPARANRALQSLRHGHAVMDSGIERRCKNCRWHFDLTGDTEHGGMKNCLAREWPVVRGIFTIPEARCDLPHKFEPLPERKAE